MQYIPIITMILVVILLGLVIVLLTRKPEKPELPQQIDPTASITALGTLVTQNLREGREAQSNQLSAMDKSLGDKMSGLTDQLGRFETRLQGFTAETTQNLTNIRETVDKTCTPSRVRQNRIWKLSAARWTRICTRSPAKPNRIWKLSAKR